MKCLQNPIKKSNRLKFLLIMKMILAFIFLFNIQMSASGFAQDLVTIHGRKLQIKDVLSYIEKQTDYRFLYNNDLASLKNNVSVSAKNASVTNVLDMVFAGTPLTYARESEKLFVIKEDPSALKEVRITGTVMDDKGSPIPNVSVQVKETTVGTATDSSGNFGTKLPSPIRRRV